MSLRLNDNIADHLHALNTSDVVLESDEATESILMDGLKSRIVGTINCEESCVRVGDIIIDIKRMCICFGNIDDRIQPKYESSVSSNIGLSTDRSDNENIFVHEIGLRIMSMAISIIQMNYQNWS